MDLYLILLTFVGLAVGLVWFLLSRDRGAKEPVDALWIAAGLGVAGALLAVFLERQLIEVDNLSPGTPQATLLATTLAVGAIEEVCKFGPLAAFIYKKRYFNEHTDGVIYFALAGLAFGLPENILYTLQYGTDTGMARLFLTPVFHAATTGLVGYFLARRKLAGKPLVGVIIPLAAVACLHGFYNFGLAHGSKLYNLGAIAITLGLSIGLFVLFLKATSRDQDIGISVVGHNAFCRTCGKANPKHNLYCVHCGKNA